MGQALYRKYRSRSLDEVVGQEHITKTLKQALKQGRISHAYLLTGPRGVGKTSVARILAHAVNDLPYDDDSTHLDIIEIDAASNRRIDEIRELRDKINVAPSSAKYKVYIIDEVHMLTREAFNALLKTLEEPPAHAIFILATTDAHKLPETIVSRTQRFSFKPIERSKVAEHLGSIAKKEKIAIDADALELLADYGDGSLRDSLSLLDQAGSQAGQIKLKDLQQLLGIPPDQAINELLEMATGGGETAGLIQALAGLYEQGYQAPAIAKKLAATLRAALVNGEPGTEAGLRLMRLLIEVPASHNPERFLEISLLRSRPPTQHAPVPPPPAEDKKPSASAPAPAQTTKAAKPVAEVPPKSAVRTLDESIWPDVLQVLKERHNTLYGIIRIAKPDFSEPPTLKLAFAFAFHQKRLNENANRQKLAAIIQEVTGQTVVIEGLHDETIAPPKLPAAADEATREPDLNLTAISNIFGEAELLES
jgi:DNA polymerase III subunit gamma/tau